MEAFFLLLVATCSAGETSFTSANFIVTGPDAATAQIIARECEHYRRTLAQCWLGGELPRWTPPAVVHLVVRTEPAYGVAWPARPNTSYRDHRLWLYGQPEEIRREVLVHELCHLILAEAGWPLPPWCDEGIAGMYDGPVHRRTRYECLARLDPNGGEVALGRLLARWHDQPLSPRDVESYSLAAAVVEFVYEQANRDGPQTLRLLQTLARGEANTARAVHKAPGADGVMITPARFVAATATISASPLAANQKAPPLLPLPAEAPPKPLGLQVVWQQRWENWLANHHGLLLMADLPDAHAVR